MLYQNMSTEIQNHTHVLYTKLQMPT